MATPLQNETYRAIDAINRMVESDESFENVFFSIQLVRKHLESRAHQTATPFIPAAPDGSITVPPLG